MSLSQHLYRIDNKGRVSLGAKLKTEAEDTELELLVDPDKLGEMVDIAAVLSNKDQEILNEVLGSAENFSARTLGVIMPKMPIPIQHESDIVASVFRQFTLQKYDLQIKKDRRFVLPKFSEHLTHPGLLFQDLKTIAIQGKVANILALAAVIPTQEASAE